MVVRWDAQSWPPCSTRTFPAHLSKISSRSCWPSWWSSWSDRSELRVEVHEVLAWRAGHQGLVVALRVGSYVAVRARGGEVALVEQVGDIQADADALEARPRAEVVRDARIRHPVRRHRRIVGVRDVATAGVLGVEVGAPAVQLVAHLTGEHRLGDADHVLVGGPC